MRTFDEPRLNIAHRGASAVAPENTLAAFERALQLGADGVELDVQFSRDFQAVVIHDDTLNRTTDGDGQVSRRTLAELQSLDAGSWFSAQFVGEKIPTLEQVLAFADGKLLLDIEIKKCRDSARLAQAVVDLLAPYDPEHYLITSFDPMAVEHVKAARAELRTGLLFNRLKRSCFQGSWDFVVPHHRLIKDRFRELAGSKKIMTWTVDDETEMRQLLAGGVGGIITNRPDILKKVMLEPKIGLTIT